MTSITSLLAAPLAALLYAWVTRAVWRGWTTADLAPLILALTLHGLALSSWMFPQGGLSLSWTTAFTLFCWQSSVLLAILAQRQPLHALGLAIYPVAALSLLVGLLWPAPEHLVTGDSKIRLHLLLALLSAGLLTLAAVQALLLLAQERWIHGHRATPLMRRLPPLMTMERLLFQLIGIGFALLSAGLLTGLWFVEDWMAQRLAHKTVLSISAWLIFGTLLLSRWRVGLRGRQATRWTLVGYGLLILAYFGSKLVLELLLGASWQAA